ncbi:MAG: sigma-70 family RNA polymerase sigma factor, partial [Kofleriaceae bacterium]|nr:sigma-70 family RNA polymerase sigma factor [Kofleriaceae bacterium]
MGHAVTDSELLAASQRGEHAAFGQLVIKYQALVCAVSFSGTRDEGLAEDVAQEAFVAAWRNLDQLRETSRFRSWLCGIARNLARQAKRRAQRETPDDTIADTALATAASPFDRASAAQHTQQVRCALTRIPALYREALVLYYQQERSVRDLAEILDISEAAALQRLSRGRSYLAQHINATVEQSLERTRPRRDLAAGVLAAIAPVGLPLPHAPPLASGATMLKFALGISAALAATGTTAWLLASAPSRQAPPKATQIAAPPYRVAAPPPSLPAPPEPAPLTLELPPLSPAQVQEQLDYLLASSRRIEPTMLARTKLYQGVSRGPADAPVVIVVFMDLECQYCGKILATIDQLWEEFPDKLRLVIKQFPLPQHAHAELAAEASLAAEAQGKYWEFHDLILASQD